MTTLISLSLAKAHLRVGDSDHEDELIAAQIQMAIGIASDITNRDLANDFDADNLPPAIKAAILLLLGTLYDNHTDQIVGRSCSELSVTAKSLLAPWRRNPY